MALISTIVSHVHAYERKAPLQYAEVPIKHFNLLNISTDVMSAYYKKTSTGAITEDKLISRRDAVKILCNIRGSYSLEDYSDSKEKLKLQNKFTDVVDFSDDVRLLGMSTGILYGKYDVDNMHIADLDGNLNWGEAIIMIERLFGGENGSFWSYSQISNIEPDERWHYIAEKANFINIFYPYPYKIFELEYNDKDNTVSAYDFILMSYLAMQRPFVEERYMAEFTFSNYLYYRTEDIVEDYKSKIQDLTSENEKLKDEIEHLKIQGGGSSPQ